MVVSVSVSVNGQPYKDQLEPRLLLVHYLRDHLGLTGTKIACDTSQCGACTVLLDGAAVRSCLMLAVQASGADVTTIEGLAVDGNLSPLQEALWECHSFQCGFCTPGFMMQTTELLRENPDADEAEIRETLSGNLCRCTGYESIVDGVLSAVEKLRTA